MKFKKILPFIFLICLSVAAVAQDNQKTVQKPFQKWSRDEALKILNAAPWSDQYQNEKGLAAVGQQQTAIGQANNRNTGAERGSYSRLTGPPVVTVRLHSALPVRQAMVRLQQIDAGYDKMSETDRAKFDESTKNFLACAICQNYYVVTVIKSKDTSVTASVNDGIFQEMKLEDFKGKVWLVNDKDEKRELAQFTAPKNSNEMAVFFFKRTDDKGSMLLTPENKMVKLMFANELLDNKNAYSSMIQRSFEFKVQKITMDGKVEF